MNLRFSDVLAGVGAAVRKATHAVPAALFAALLALALVATPARAAEGAPAIAYDGAANELTVTGGYEAGGSDLFASFKGLAPGDSVTQTVDLSFTNISAETRLFIKADTAGLSADARAVLSELELSVGFTGSGAFSAVELASPHEVFAGEDPVLVATVAEPAEAVMTLTLTIPTSVGNELAELQEVRIPWVITVQEDDGETGEDEGPVSTALTPHAIDLVAYEGGLGTDATATSVGNALPEPVWTNVDWESAQVTVDNAAWDVATQGLPFRWAYGTVATDPALVTASARAGYYYLLVAPLEGDPVVTVNGRLLTLPADHVVTRQDGSDVMMQVRDVTDDAAADTLDSSHFKGVYGGETSLQRLQRALTSALGSFVLPAYAAPAGTLSGALEGDFAANGTHADDCDNTVAHAHVAAGTTFIKNGNADLPVGAGARIGLLWDDFIPGVLGESEREGVLDAKARAAAGGAFASSDAVQHRFKYLDLVDMNDGNVWVATADGSAVTVFVPYFGSLSAEDDIAVVYFDGLTRDYTLDMASADLDAEIAATSAHALQVTKTADGLIFEVPWAQFGPFELMWIDADAPTPGGDDTDDPDQGGQQAVDETDRPHGDLVQTGDSSLAIIALLVCIAVVVIVAGIVLSRRSGRSSGRDPTARR